MSPPQVIRLPDGQLISVTPVFAGLFFKSHELSTPQHAIPAGWSIVIQTEDDRKPADSSSPGPKKGDDHGAESKPAIHSYTKPTLQNDALFISSVSTPASSDFKPAASPTRQIAMMLWVTLYWYFHQPAPSPILQTETSKATPTAGRPRGDWKIRIRRDGVLRGRNLIPKLERMGLIASADSSVGTALDDSDDPWANMFVSRKMFWQIPGRLFLFSLQPNLKNLKSYPCSPVVSRPGSPAQAQQSQITDVSESHTPLPPCSMPSYPIGPFFSASYLPTYYPPAPLQYTITNHVRHPIRPKPPRMGEVFYTRFVPSVGQYLAFRVASISPKPVPYFGPVSPNSPQGQSHLTQMTDLALIQAWHQSPRVSAFWGECSVNFLTNALKSRHSFPVIGMWDGVPFGYFELYWVKEDLLGRYIGGESANDWDRGVHVLIGEEWARGRVQAWLSSLVHYAFTSEYRTMSMCVEPRVDNVRFIQHLEYAGFAKEKEVTFPHKQAWFGRLRRESWEGPAL
ncbi:acyl-CoA N-acyltransferase [Sordaria sp. MPI-SDFR-AT-0083]|nr:acyl-CoA N-acyltransferase [Sordaria sp. MPI-SDFR-AT-0083]